MSGLNQQFTKLSAFTGPRVRISLSPPVVYNFDYFTKK